MPRSSCQGQRIVWAMEVVSNWRPGSIHYLLCQNPGRVTCNDVNIITSDFYIGIYYSRCCVLVFEVVTFTTTLLHGCMIGSLGSCTQIFHIFQPWKSCLQGASVDMSCREKKQSTSLTERYWYYMFLGCKITLYNTQRALYTLIWHRVHITEGL